MQESVSNSGSTVVPGIHFAEVRARITLADVLDLLGFVPCESSGDQVRGPCLVHHSISPLSRSFSANLKRNIYRCFKFGSSGNQLDLYAAVTGLGVFEATVALCEQLHREIPWMLNGTSAQARTASRFAPDQALQSRSGRESSRRTGLIPRVVEQSAPQPLRWYSLVSQSGAHSACKRQPTTHHLDGSQELRSALSY